MKVKWKKSIVNGAILLSVFFMGASSILVIWEEFEVAYVNSVLAGVMGMISLAARALKESAREPGFYWVKVNGGWVPGQLRKDGWWDYMGGTWIIEITEENIGARIER